MTEWIVGIGNNKENEEVSSIASGDGANAQSSEVPPKPESITQLGPTYEVKKVSVKKEDKGGFPGLIFSLIIIIPIMLLLTLGMVSRKREITEEKSFLFKTIESKYFTANYPPDYDIHSAVDKTVPFIEKHTLTSDVDGQKTLDLIIKDIPFDYGLRDNTRVKVVRDKSEFYDEKPYELSSKEGTYFTKIEENFEHLVVLIDRNRSLVYEIVFVSQTSLSENLKLEREFVEFLNSITFL